MGNAETGYYSLDVYQGVDHIEAVGACTRQTAFPDYSKLKPAVRVHQYRVEMQVNYRPGDHPINFRITSNGKLLSPWQAYASYDLTGGFVLYGHCGGGYVVAQVFGTSEAHPSHFASPKTSSDMAAYDPESAAAVGKKDLLLGFTCVRWRLTHKQTTR